MYILCKSFVVTEILEQTETVYEEIRDSHLDPHVEDVSPGRSSSWSEDSSFDDTIHYYIQPVNEYENTVWTVYENYKQSDDGYEEGVKSQDIQSKSSSNNSQQDGYEIPETHKHHLTYEILSGSPEEVEFFVRQ